MHEEMKRGTVVIIIMFTSENELTTLRYVPLLISILSKSSSVQQSFKGFVSSLVGIGNAGKK